MSYKIILSVTEGEWVGKTITPNIKRIDVELLHSHDSPKDEQFILKLCKHIEGSLREFLISNSKGGATLSTNF